MTLYEKRGRRYVPVAEEVAYDAFPEGAHLVVVQPGLRSTIFRINPDEAAIRAACRVIEDEVKTAITNGLAMRPRNNRSLSPAQMKAWRAFEKAMGDERFIVEFPSVAEIAESVAAIIRRKATEIKAADLIREEGE